MQGGDSMLKLWQNKAKEDDDCGEYEERRDEDAQTQEAENAAAVNN